MKTTILSVCLFLSLTLSHSFESGFIPRKNHAAVIFNNKVHVLGGINGYIKGKFKSANDIWVSDKLNRWTLLAKNFLRPLRTGFSATSFKGKIWVIGGLDQENGRYLNDVWNSEDGIKWKQVILSAPFNGRANASVFIFKDKLWLLGGIISSEGKYISDVWCSDTGTEWNKAADDLHFFSYYECQVKVLNDRVFLFSYGEGIYSSADCVNWEKIQTNDEMNKKFFYSVEVFDGNLFVLCGQNRSAYYAFGGFLNEVWKSPDGKNWTMVSPYPESAVESGINFPPFSIKPGRSGPASFIFSGKLCISGGMDDEGNFLNDIWYSDDGSRWFKVE